MRLDYMRTIVFMVLVAVVAGAGLYRVAQWFQTLAVSLPQ